jgi:hypothetical protein
MDGSPTTIKGLSAVVGMTRFYGERAIARLGTSFSTPRTAPA